jgi:hypothetical protein
MPLKKNKQISNKSEPIWSHWEKEKLLDVRLCDLKMSIPGTIIETRIKRLENELKKRKLRVRPYFWLSDDWFTPDGYTGIAIPFYLAHPRLVRLELTMASEVEGGSFDWCMKLLRHEAGHVVQHAFKLHRRRQWQQLFGLSSHRYPRFYRPNPYSKRHVFNLDYWYAQSHPDEDFAETFAVWLQPRSNWKKKYMDWPALKKIEYVDQLMAELTDKKPLVTTKAKLDTLPQLKKTLREHYQRKLNGTKREYPDFYDRDLTRLFISTPQKKSEAASAFIRRAKPQILSQVSDWIGDYDYHLKHVLKEMTGRCRELKLYANGSEQQMKNDFSLLLIKYTMDSLYRSRRWVEM